MKFYFLKKSFLQNLRGYAHIMLCFPIKSEIGQNFRVHSAGLVSVICRKMVLCVLSFRGMTSDERGAEEKRHPRPGSKKKKTKQTNKKKTIKHNQKMCFFWFLFCYEHNFKCLLFFSPQIAFLSLCFYFFSSVLCFFLPYVLFLFFVFLFWGFSFLPLLFVFPYSCLVSLLFLLDMSLGACFFYLVCFLVFHEKNNFNIFNQTGFFDQYLLRCGF